MLTNLQKFNNQLKCLINDLNNLNTDTELIDITKFNYLLKCNNKMGLELFRKHILKDDINRIMIFEEEEVFFLNKDFNSDIKFNFLLEIKKKWNNLNNENKKKIWNYFKILIYFSDNDLNISTLDYNNKIIFYNQKTRC
jgi:hypothetical protein